MVEVETYDKDDFVPLAENIEKKITERTKVLILNSPNNPTGAVIPLEEMEKIRSLVIKYNLMVISDEPYERLIYDGAEHISIASLGGMKERTITVNTFSKTYAMSGWRVGYACGPEKVIQAMVLLKEYTSSSVNACAQYACVEALENTDKVVLQMREEYKSRRDFVVSALKKCDFIKCQIPKGAFYLFANIQSTRMSSCDLAKKILKETQVAITPGTAFGSCGEGFLRISYASSMKKLKEAMERIQRFQI